MFEHLPSDAGISRPPSTFIPVDAAATDDDYLSRLVDMGDAPAQSYSDWHYLSADESHQLEIELAPDVDGVTAAGIWLLQAADPTRVNWQRNKWWGEDDVHLQ